MEGGKMEVVMPGPSRDGNLKRDNEHVDQSSEGEAGIDATRNEKFHRVKKDAKYFKMKNDSAEDESQREIKKKRKALKKKAKEAKELKSKKTKVKIWNMKNQEMICRH